MPADEVTFEVLFQRTVFPGPRDLSYWRYKLGRAQAEVGALRKGLAERGEPPPSPRMPRGEARRQAVERWQKSERHRRWVMKRLVMLVQTKIPYYEGQILRLTPTVWDRLAGPDVL